MNIYQKLIEVRKTVPYIQKADKGAQYQYTGSSRVLAAVVDKMNELGLLLIPSVTGHTLRESTVEFIEKDNRGNEKPKRTTTYFTELEMTMTWVNAEKPEEQIVSSWYGQGVDIAGEKGVGKALTYAEKYYMLKFFNIATDKDDPDAFQRKHDLDPPEEKIDIPPASLKEKYRLGKGNMDGFNEWVKTMQGKGNNFKQMETALTEALDKKKQEDKKHA
jgi:hypothetical protein